MYTYNCDYCKETFIFDKRTQPGAHKTNCLMNPKRNQFLENVKRSNPNIKQKRILNCEKCGVEYEVLVSNKRFIEGKYKKNCSYKCSNIRILDEEVKNKISKTLRNKNKDDKNKENRNKQKTKNFKDKRNCLLCNKVFECNKKSSRKYCSLNCVGSVGGRNSVQGRRSKNEELFYDLCKDKFKNVTNNENIFNGWDADIILHNEKIAIMWNGVWHYRKIKKSHSLEQVQNRDKIKIEEIKKCGYSPYVIKDMGKFNPKFVESEFNLFLERYKIQDKI